LEQLGDFSIWSFVAFCVGFLLYVVVGLSKTFISFCCRFVECFFLLVGLHLKPFNIKISQVNERV
jgi:hypothetical protein